MRWTKTPPTVAGYWWVRLDPDADVAVAQFFHDGSFSFTYTSYRDWTYEYPDALYSGPLTPPPLPDDVPYEADEWAGITRPEVTG